MRNRKKHSVGTEAEKIIRGRARGRALLNVQDISAITGEHPATIRNRVAAGTYDIPSIRHSGRRLWLIDDVLNHLAGGGQ